MIDDFTSASKLRPVSCEQQVTSVSAPASIFGELGAQLREGGRRVEGIEAAPDDRASSHRRMPPGRAHGSKGS